MPSHAATPENLTIERRDLMFGRDGANPRWWHSNDAGITAFYNALSATFPLGERFFMDAVRRYRDETPEPLRSQIADFLFQEATHSREHVVFNQQATANGYDIAKLESRTQRLVTFARTRKPIVQLAATCALEHFTATLAHAAFADPAHLNGAAPEAKRLWRWHAIEEIEHKSVAYDTFLQVTRSIGALPRWMLRCLIMMFTTVRFHYIVGRGIADLLKQDGRNNFRTWAKLLRYLYGKPGPMRLIVAGAFGYCRPGFHPWDQDDRALLERARLTL